MALRLTLKPNERVIIGGAAVRNGSTRAEFLIENRVPVLREPDILSPSAVRTPCERVVLALQLLYVDVDQADEHCKTYRELIADVAEAAPSCRQLIDDIDLLVQSGQYYQALKRARDLLDHERDLFKSV